MFKGPVSLAAEYQFTAVRKTIRKGLTRLGGFVAAAPSLSFPDMAGSAGRANGFYRYFGRKEITPGVILEPHYNNTKIRIGKREVLVVHDTTDIVLSGDRGDFGYLHGHSFGFKAHVSLAIASDGSREPLGVVALETLNRESKKPPPAEERRHNKAKSVKRQDPKRESERWWRGIVASQQAVESKRIIHVGDAETDNYALMSRAIDNGYRFVFRVSQDRLIESEAPEIKRLFDLRSHSKSIMQREVTAAKRAKQPRSKKHPNREGRIAELYFASHQVTLPKPIGQAKSLAETISVNVVHVWEAKAPEGEDPIEWMLLTTEPTGTKQDVEKIVDWYRSRWLIEEFFKGLKSVCKIEERQLESYHSLSNALAIFIPSVWHMLYLQFTERNLPDLPATEVLSAEEITVLETIPPRKLKKGATTAELLLIVASWGGHMPQNGAPGWQILYKGYRKLQDAVTVWRLLRSATPPPQN